MSRIDHPFNGIVTRQGDNENITTTAVQRMKTGPYFALALILIVATGEAFGGSPVPHKKSASFFAQDCFIAAGGTAGAYNLRCKGHPITTAEGGERYSNLSPRQQVAADVAAEELTSQHRHDVSRFRENVR